MGIVIILVTLWYAIGFMIYCKPKEKSIENSKDVIDNKEYVEFLKSKKSKIIESVKHLEYPFED